MTTSRYAMIMAGGSGTRLWPMSRQRRPKQLLPMIAGRSLLEIAAERLDDLVPPEHRLICAGESFRPAIRAALPAFGDGQILGEPEGRDTVNAVGFTAAVLAETDPDAVFAVLTSDHLIEPVEALRRRLDVGFSLVEQDPSRFVTFAIKATFAATGFGWVERGEAIPGFEGAYDARQFHEKPDAAAAQRYLETTTFGWNSGMFVFQAAALLDAIDAFWPGSSEGLRAIGEAWGTDRQERVLAEVYPTLPKENVDRAVMMPAASDPRFRICCVPLDVSWIDVGSWPSYGETLDEDENGNRTNARAVHLGSKDVLAVSDDPEHVIATLDCADLIVVRTKDVTMVCPAKSAQRVKEFVAAVEESLR